MKHLHKNIRCILICLISCFSILTSCSKPQTPQEEEVKCLPDTVFEKIYSPAEELASEGFRIYVFDEKGRWKEENSYQYGVLQSQVIFQYAADGRIQSAARYFKGKKILERTCKLDAMGRIIEMHSLQTSSISNDTVSSTFYLSYGTDIVTWSVIENGAIRIIKKDYFQNGNEILNESYNPDNVLYLTIAYTYKNGEDKFMPHTGATDLWWDFYGKDLQSTVVTRNMVTNTKTRSRSFIYELNPNGYTIQSTEFDTTFSSLPLYPMKTVRRYTYKCR